MAERAYIARELACRNFPSLTQGSTFARTGSIHPLLMENKRARTKKGDISLIINDILIFINSNLSRYNMLVGITQSLVTGTRQRNAR